MNAKIEKKPVGSLFGLFVNNVLIGTSKTQFDADHAVVMLRKALGLESSRETWRIIYVPFGAEAVAVSKTNHTFDTLEEANDWIRIHGKEIRCGLYRAERD